MQSLQVIACLATSLSVAGYAATIPANTKLGAEVFNSQKCVFCHSVNGTGGDSAPDLARRPDGRYSPAAMAADESMACILSRQGVVLPWAKRPKRRLAGEIIKLLADTS